MPAYEHVSCSEQCLRNRMKGLMSKARGLNSSAPGRTGGRENPFCQRAWGAIEAIISARDTQQQEKEQTEAVSAAATKKMNSAYKSVVKARPMNAQPTAPNGWSSA